MSEPALFRTQRRVEFSDTDMAGIIHFSAFFRFMEAAEHEFLRSRGLSVVLEWEGERIGFPRVSATCDFIAPVRFEDVLDVTVRIDRMGTKSITYAIEFFHQGTLAARGSITCVCCLVPGKSGGLTSIPIPAGLRARLDSPV
jgi:4-hydroxybenzoyl-CoA thioesterase/acyl-CoA thioester hydrolase